MMLSANTRFEFNDRLPMKVEPVPPLQLQNHQLLDRALWLVDHYFPEPSNAYDRVSRDDWLNVLYDLYDMVESAGWFEVDWETLDNVRKKWLHHRECVTDECLADFLHYLPVKLYGFSDIQARFEYKPLDLIYALLSEPDHTVFFEEMGEQYGLDSCWNKASYEAAWKRLEAIDAQPFHYPEPVRWLPALAAWTCRCTSNIILLRSAGDPFSNKRRFTWDHDLDRIKQAWRQARPVIEVYDRLARWCRQNKTNVDNLVCYLGCGDGLDKLDW